LGVDMVIPETNTLVAEIGRVVEVSQKEIKMVSTVPSGSVMIDGLSVGDVGSVVLRDRRLLSEEGLIVVTAAISKKTGRILAGPEITSRGFVYVRESEELMEQIKQVCIKAIESTTASREWGNTKQKVRDQLSQYLFSKTKRRPLILPIIQEIDS
jgi:ribonuclease J